MDHQLCLHTADLLAVAECRDRDRAIYIAELCRFVQRERRNALTSGKLEGVCNVGIVLVAANLNFVGVRFAVVDELSLYGLFSDQSI